MLYFHKLQKMYLFLCLEDRDMFPSKTLVSDGLLDTKDRNFKLSIMTSQFPVIPVFLDINQGSDTCTEFLVLI